MKFGIDTIRLWSHQGEIRDVDFERGHINVLSGSSNRGKTSLLHIIDYCLLSSSHKIPHDVINDTVDWYGIKLYINDKEFVIARKSPHAQTVSDNFYLSSVGAFPPNPVANATSDDIKKILQSEFGLNNSVVLYGGRGVRYGTQVSFRYFLLFNTISEDIITNTSAYFDHQQDDRYRVALPRVLDLGLGIDNLDNIEQRERRDDLRRMIEKLEKKKKVMNGGRHLFESEARQLAASAAEYGLIEKVPAVVTIDFLREIVKDVPMPDASGEDAKRLTQARSKLFEVNRRMRRLREFSDEHKLYKTALKTTHDSLKPLESLLKQSDELLRTDIFDDLIDSLNVDLRALKAATAAKQPVDTQVNVLMDDLKEQKAEQLRIIESLPKEQKSFDDTIQLVKFVTRIETKLETYTAVAADSPEDYESQVAALTRDLEAMEVTDVASVRDGIVGQINDVSLTLLSEAAAAMDNYATFKTSFNYETKKLQLRRPQSSFIENVGSSSNHMFLHLFMFLALHEVAISRGGDFVPSFLFIDQPSRPYYGEEKIMDEVYLRNSDQAKVSQAFELLGSFVTRMKKHHDTEFQMIVLEHVPVELFQDVANVKLLPEFRGKNALIPPHWRPA
ncbi:DUF3732 domain-containing protein [Pseudomonas syringae group genomosp. 3]|uniref:DUF3732 domain-containing protein n=1 Tax=Pseudomonas syringae pv. primulae TaxID=251707 RepID=A0A3M3XXI2_9PSED|nr:DUF3732 domain-containing protein [Pseudomonas syringae group genomosp. 3]RMO74718.1 hypothetical protein ALQ36_01826 [Pseudomonas syringae pv. primulae]RMU40339.1 hypothetical protein ALP30_04168 [Pseudomonas syringae pv. primulae]